MGILDDLRAQAEQARAEAAAVALNAEEAETARLLAEIESAREEAQASAKTRRELDGKAREGKARAAAGGKYLVKYIDVGALLPDADPALLPGGGVIVVRSAPTQPVDALGNFYRDVEAKTRPLPDVYLDLVLASVVDPETTNDAAAGVRLRGFFESPLGKGTVIVIGDAVTDLSGVRRKEAKRGR